MKLRIGRKVLLMNGWDQQLRIEDHPPGVAVAINGAVRRGRVCVVECSEEVAIRIEELVRILGEAWILDSDAATRKEGRALVRAADAIKSQIVDIVADTLIRVERRGKHE